MTTRAVVPMVPIWRRRGLFTELLSVAATTVGPPTRLCVSVERLLHRSKH